MWYFFEKYSIIHIGYFGIHFGKDIERDYFNFRKDIKDVTCR